MNGYKITQGERIIKFVAIIDVNDRKSIVFTFNNGKLVNGEYKTRHEAETIVKQMLDSEVVNDKDRILEILY